jgi:hypothetical protein
LVVGMMKISGPDSEAPLMRGIHVETSGNRLISGLCWA